jgi:uncharacterized Zn finger protein (UPF0148 family)
MKEYCERCKLPLREWEWCGRGMCEVCEDKITQGTQAMTTATETKVTARATAFAGQGVREHRFLVDTDGTVRVWDSIAGYYTACHGLSDAAQRRIRKLAAN